MYLIGCQDDSTDLALGTIIEVGGRKKMTNREWINSLSNEQLVKLMHSFHEDNCCMCADNGKDDCCFCYDKQVEWMEMEHDAERWEERDYRYSFW